MIPQPSSVHIILIRHGRTAWNVGEGKGQRFRGVIDLPLADEGVIQAQATAQRLAGEPLVAVHCSPLQRAVHTAQIIAEPHGLPAQALSGLNSMDYGQWSGLLHTEVAHRWPELYRRWRQDPFSVQIPRTSDGGESMQDLRDRAVAAVHQALDQAQEAYGRNPTATGKAIAVVSHQVVTRTLCCALAGLPNPAYWHIRQDLCNLSRFDYDLSSGGLTLVGLNDTCHLNRGLPGASAHTADADRRGTRVLLICHGQTAWNEGAGEERFRGRTDLPLDSTGQAQARAVAARLENEPLTALYTSPLLRAQQTMAPLGHRTPAATEGSDSVRLLVPIQPHEGLLDINYGRLQGLTHSEARATYPELYAQWRTTPAQVHFPGGERLADVQARLLALLDELVARHPGETVALMGHQMLSKVLACTLLGLDLDEIWRIRQDTAGIDVFQQVAEPGSAPSSTWQVLCLNDTCHLASLA